MLSKSDVIKKVNDVAQNFPKGLLYQEDDALKAAFTTIWLEYDAYLSELVVHSGIKKAANLPIFERIPAQEEWLVLQEMCLTLTECWYGQGQGNLSRVYFALHACDEAAGLVAYPAGEIVDHCPKTGLKLLHPHRRKRLADENARQEKQEMALASQTQVLQENIVASGRSPIDRLTVRNIFMQEENEALMPLFKRARLKQAVHKFLAPVERGRSAVDHQEKIDKEKRLDTYAKEKFPDPEEILKNNFDFNTSAIGSPYKEMLFSAKKYPGRYFKDDRNTHMTTLFSGLLSNKLAIQPRSKIENLKPHRYLVFNWERTTPVYAWDASTQSVVERRAIGAKEQSRLISNKYPYGYFHGLSLCSQGSLEGLKQYGTPSYEWNIPRDPDAFLPNVDVFDPEKMVVEFERLNPKGSATEWLPKEQAVLLGKNPPNASSIQNTQHHQIMTGHLLELPAYQQDNNPTWHEALGVSVDCIQVGRQEDGCFYKLQGRLPISEMVSSILSSLWCQLMTRLGGTDSVEEFLQIFSDTSGGFCIIFTPFARLQHRKDEYGYTVTNTLTREVIELKEPGTFGISNGAGCAPQEFGLPDLASLYDFIAYPGMRAVMEELLRGIPALLEGHLEGVKTPHVANQRSMRFA